MKIRSANINYPWKKFTPQFIDFSKSPKNNGSRYRVNLTTGNVEIEVKLISDSEKSTMRLRAEP